ncbi:MAG: cobaltochelatase subunit CobN [Flavonifractor plautii]
MSAPRRRPRLRQTTDELDLLLAGVEGRFVPPLARRQSLPGNAHILPTGRNFYAIDPAAVPSRAAWTVGQALAEQAVDAYRAQKGEPWPESVAIVVYSDECMKTNGEDIAEVFALMGVRPRYLGQTDKVVGVEPIPLAELGRPRIDAGAAHQRPVPGHLPQRGGAGGAGGAGRGRPG